MQLLTAKKLSGAVGLLVCLNLGGVGMAQAELVRPEVAKASSVEKDDSKVGTVLNPGARSGDVIRVVNVASVAGEKSETASKTTPRKTASAKASSSPRGGAGKSKYASLIRAAAQKHGVPVSIAKAVVQVESNFNSRARGSVGEVGLMQIRPQTARGMGYRGSVKALYHPETNLEWGMRYLAGAYKKAGGDVCGTILRYNAGHYAKRMNPVSRRYCQRVKSIIGSS